MIVLDSFGLGSTPDAYRFGDAGANTLGAIATAAAEAHAAGERPRVLTLPNLERLGLGEAALTASGRYPAGFSGNAEIVGAWGAAREQSSGKDTPSGHWELAGLPVLFDWGYFSDRDQSFPPQLLETLVAQAGLPGLLGNCHASGTEILKRLVKSTSNRVNRLSIPPPIACSRLPHMNNTSGWRSSMTSPPLPGDWLTTTRLAV